MVATPPSREAAAGRRARGGSGRGVRFVRTLGGYLTRWLQRFSATGILLGTLFFALSLAPSLVPRPAGFQGLLSGLSFSIGYLIGITGRWLWIVLELPPPSARTHTLMLRVAGVICVGAAVTFLWRATEWQNSVRLLMEMEPVDTVHPVRIALITLLVFLLAVFVGRQFQRTFRLIAGRLKRFVPRRIAYLLGGVLATALFWTLTEGVVFSAALRLADSSYQQLDDLIPTEWHPRPIRGRRGALRRSSHGRRWVSRAAPSS